MAGGCKLSIASHCECGDPITSQDRIGVSIVDTGGVVSGVSVRIGSFTGHIIVHTQPIHASMPQCNTKLLKLIDILNLTFSIFRID